MAAAWIALVTGLPPQMCGPRLPPDTLPDGSAAPWVRTGFATVQTVGGDIDMFLPVHRPVLQVDCYRVKPGSSEPPWNKAAALGEAITVGCWQRTGFNLPLAIEVEGEPYPAAVVLGGYLATAFRRLYADEADFARLTANLALTWVTPSLTIP